MDDTQHLITKRIDDLRSDYTRRFETIDRKLDEISKGMRATTPCPAPGSCIDQGRAIAAHSIQVEKLELRIMSIERWQNKVIGVGSVLVVIATLFGPTIRTIVGLGT